MSSNQQQSTTQRQSQPGTSQTSYSGARVDVREAPVVVQQINKPAVVHEVIRPEEVVEVQPVIERQRERLDVYEVVQPLREREVVATEVRQGVLPPQTRATFVADQSAFLAQRSAPGDTSTREVAPTMHATFQNAPIVHETITHKVVEEVQPVIYKEIDRPVLIKETLPIHERIVEAPQAHHSVLPVRDLGTRTTVTNDIAAVQYQTTGLHSGIHSSGIASVSGQPGYQPALGQQFSGTNIPHQTTGFQSGSNFGGQQGVQQGLGQQGWQQGQPLQSGTQGQQWQGQQWQGQPSGQGQGLGQPLTGQGTTQSFTGQGTNQPFSGQGTTQPFSEQGTNQPFTGQGTNQPFTGQGTSQPYSGQGLTGQGSSQPLTGQGFTGQGQGVGQPLTGQGIAQQPLQSGLQQGLKNVEGSLGSFATTGSQKRRRNSARYGSEP
jgi:hypothetical protein